MRRKRIFNRSSADRTLRPLNGVAIRFLEPHSILFALYSAVYFFPLYLASINRYGEGLVAETSSAADLIMPRIAMVYILGVGSFCLGSMLTPWITWLFSPRIGKRTE